MPSTLGTLQNLKLLTSHIYTDDEIENFDIREAISNHPIAHRPVNTRSRLAYQQLMKNTKTTTKYLLPGQLCMFYYNEPKFKEELEYYDKTPLTLFCGITRTKDNTIREVGFNLHYFPPFTRARILELCYVAFMPYWEKNFNEHDGKPNTHISYKAIKKICSRSDKLAFGIKMYVPILRSEAWVIPPRLFSTAFYTEGHFSKATMNQIFKFWRTFE